MIASAIRSVMARVGISAINGIQLPMVPMRIFSRVSRFTARKTPLSWSHMCSRTENTHFSMRLRRRSAMAVSPRIVARRTRLRSDWIR